MNARSTIEKQLNIDSQYSGGTEKIKKATCENSTQTDFHSDEQKSDSQIFNIHIHLPDYKISDLMGFSKTQPEVHVHFDGLVTKLNTNKRKRSEVSANELTNLSSNFEKVKFHNFKKGCDITIKIPRAAVNHCIGDDPNVDGITEKVQTINKSEIVKCSKKNISFCSRNKNRNKIKSHHQEPLKQTLYEDIFLKQPVVLLEDICKTRAYKALGVSVVNNLDKLKNGENGSCVCDEDPNAVKFKNPDFSVKVENESFNNRSVSPNCSEKSYFSSASDESSHFQIECKSSKGKGKSLTELAEGCNFSELLSRFKLKTSKGSFEDIFKSSDSTIKTENTSTLINNEEPNKKMEEHFVEENKNDASSGALKILVQHKTENLDNDMPSQRLHSVPSSYSDDYNVESKMLPSIIESNTAFTSYSNDLKVSEESSSNNSNDFDCTDFELELLRQEMQKRQTTNPQKSEMPTKLKRKRLGAESAQLPSPNKMKPTNKGSGNSHKSTKTPSMEEDYIPLQTSGATKFAVVQLNNVKPYKTHEAKNFKSEMLFGNRVNRFTESTQLRIYNIKKSQKDTVRPNYS